MRSRHRAADCEQMPVSGRFTAVAPWQPQSDFYKGTQARLHIFPKMKPLEATPFMRLSFGAAWINTVRHFRTVNPRLRGFAPCKGEIPRVQNKVLCDGCISLSNAEGLGKGLRPPRKLLPDTPWTTPMQFVELILHRHKKAVCLKTDIPVSRQTATYTPLFATFRLLFSLILRA